MAKVTRAYGVHRGKRMRETALAHQDPADLQSYFVYGEWKGKPGENQSEMTYEKDSTVSTVHRCAWFDTWKQYGLEQYGTLYCHYIDYALTEGFAGNFGLDVEQSFSRGDRQCIFRWNQGVDKEKLQQIRNDNQDAYIRSFSFHCSDMLAIARLILHREIPSLADRIIEETEKDFESLGSA